MPDAATAAPAAPAPVPQSAAPAAAPSPAPTAGTPPKAGQPTEAQAPEAAKPESTAAELRRSAELARQKRIAAQHYAERQRFENSRKEWETKQAETLKKAQEFDRYSELAKKDPLAFNREVGIDFQSLAKAQIAETTGHGKTQAELVNEAVEKRLAELRQTDEQQAKARSQAEQRRQDEQIRQGAARQLANLIQTKAEDFELCSYNPAHAVQQALETMEAVWKNSQEPVDDPVTGRPMVDPATGKVITRGHLLPYDKALAYVEEQLLEKEREKVSKSKKVGMLFEERKRAAAEAEKAAAAKAESAKQPLSAFHKSQPKRSLGSAAAEAEHQAAQAVPTPKKRPNLYVNYRQVADEILLQSRAKQDS